MSASRINNTTNQADKPRQAVLYWCSDTRPPSDIFESGFRPRITIDPIDWWQYAIYSHNGVSTSHAKKSVCVCMSSCFYSAPLFPEYEKDSTNETWLYAIALPAASKIDLNKALIDPCVDALPNDRVIDLHSYQVAQLDAVLSANEQRYRIFPSMAMTSGWALYGYEHIAYEVKRKNIIGAIKLQRYAYSNAMIVSELTAKVVHSVSNAFSLDGEFLENPHFMARQYHGSDVLNCQQSREAAKRMVDDKQGQVLRTMRIMDGLAGKTFASPADGYVEKIQAAEFQRQHEAEAMRLYFQDRQRQRAAPSSAPESTGLLARLYGMFTPVDPVGSRPHAGDEACQGIRRVKP